MLPLLSPSLSLTFFNLSLLSGEVPIAWKAATVIPLLKRGDQADPNCYRHISTLPCLSKVLEKLVDNQLTGFLDVYSILSGMQCGAAIFIDLAKAFDTVDHSILVGRLRNKVSLRALWLGLLTTSLKECSV